MKQFDMLHVKTIDDLLFVTALDAAGIECANIEYSGDLVFKLKIRGENWDDPELLDYRVAQIIDAFQRDILAIVNQHTTLKVSINDLSKHPDLVVKFKVEEGCIKILSETLQRILEYTKEFTTEEKMKTMRMIFLSVIIISSSWFLTTTVEKAADIYIAQMNNETKVRLKEMDVEIEKVREGVEPTIQKAQETLSQEKRTPKAVARNVDNDDVITTGDGSEIKGETLKAVYADRPDETTYKTYRVDAKYKVTAYNFEKRKAELKGEGRPFWAQTNYLKDNERAQLIELDALAIKSGKPQIAELQVTVEISEGKITSATIAGFGSPREDAVSLSVVLNQAKDDVAQPQQATLQF